MGCTKPKTTQNKHKNPKSKTKKKESNHNFKRHLRLLCYGAYKLFLKYSKGHDSETKEGGAVRL